MASLVTYKNGLRRIDFSMTPNGPRRSVRLGRMPAKSANAIHARVEQIIADKISRRPHDAEVCHWLAELDETLLGRLRANGLADGVGVTQTTLGDFLERFKATQTVKPSTATFYNHTRRNLREYFKPARLLCDITEADADGWRAWLVSHEGLSNATVARRVVAARTMWRSAIRWKLTASNPFVGIRSGSQLNESRKRYIDRGTVERVIDACPDAEWRLMVALARFGGVRTPSETLTLTWRDIDWERGTIQIHSPKTAHHDNHATRTIPLFPELRTPLLEALERCEEGGSEFVITRYREQTQNLGTHFRRIIKRAGLTPWPRLWQNLRASRETELMRQYDLATVCRWIGNSPAVAAKHYAMSSDLNADFRRACGMPEAVTPQYEATEAQQKAQQPASANASQAQTDEPHEVDNPTKDNAFVHRCPRGASEDKSIYWAIQDSNL